MIDDGTLMLGVRFILNSTPTIPAVLWPNTAVKLAAPFLVYSNGFSSAAQTYTLDGHQVIDVFPLISIMDEVNVGTTETDRLVGLLCEAFKATTPIRHPISGDFLGEVVASPTPDGARRDGKHYRTDLTIPIRARIHHT